METTKDRTTEYWGNEIKRAAEETAKALAEYNQAKEEELEALNRQLDAEDNNADAETKEEASEIHRQKSFISAQKWQSCLIAVKWEYIPRFAADINKNRKAAKEANK